MRQAFSWTHRLGGVVLALAGGLASGLHAPAWAFDANSPSVFNVDGKGLALKGYDPVAYFSATGAGPMLGKAEFTATVDGTVYRFVSAANRDAFVAGRGRYLPGYGGFCAMAVTRGKKVDADPRVWHIDEGRLYLHANKDEQKRWLENVAGNLVAGDKNWRTIRDKAPKTL